MADLFKEYETDETLCREGVWYHYDDETSFLIARAGATNDAFMARLEVLTRPHLRKIKDESIKLKVLNGLTQRAWSETILLDWKGFIYKGKTIKFSKDNAVKYMEEFTLLYDELRLESQRISNFRLEKLEEDAGN